MTTAMIIGDDQNCLEILKSIIASVASEEIKLLAKFKTQKTELVQLLNGVLNLSRINFIDFSLSF